MGRDRERGDAASTRLREDHRLPTAAAFNERVPVGTAVRYFPIRGHFAHLETRTRSVAWELGSGAPVVMIDGKSGGVAIEHLVLIEDGELEVQLVGQIDRAIADLRAHEKRIERFGAVLGKLVAIVNRDALGWSEHPALRAEFEQLLADIAAIDEGVGDGQG